MHLHTPITLQHNPNGYPKPKQAMFRKYISTRLSVCSQTCNSI